MHPLRGQILRSCFPHLQIKVWNLKRKLAEEQEVAHERLAKISYVDVYFACTGVYRSSSPQVLSAILPQGIGCHSFS